MENVVSAIKSMPGYIGSNGRDEAAIEHAERLLDTHFASDYRVYLSEIGLACFDGHELTGICASKRLNVVEVTLSARGVQPAVPQDWYVLEEANIDGIVIWQSGAGEVFQTQPGAEPVKLAASIREYLNM